MSAFKAWLHLNRDRAYKSGYVRADGMVFISYEMGYHNGEHWTTPELFEKQKERVRQVQRRLRRDPEFKTKYNAYTRKRYAEKQTVREKSHQLVKKHRMEKPEMNRATTMRRYARKWNQTHSGHNPKIELGLFALATAMTRLTGEKYQVDHIIPIAAGGWHHHDNMQVLPRRINTSKNDNPFWESPSAAWKDWRHVPRELWPEHLAAAYEERLYERALTQAA